MITHTTGLYDINVDPNATYILSVEALGVSSVIAIYPDGKTLTLIAELSTGQYALVPPTSTIQLKVQTGSLKYELTRSFNISSIPMQNGGVIGGDINAINEHNASNTSHADIRLSISTGLVPQSGMAQQVLIKWGAEPGQHRWQTPPWASSHDLSYYYKQGNQISTSQSLVIDGRAVVFRPYNNIGNALAIVNRNGVLGTMPSSGDDFNTSFAGFAPLGGGSGNINLSQHNFANLDNSIPTLSPGVYQINLTYFFKNDSLIGGISNGSYATQLQYSRPFNFSSNCKVYTSAISVSDAANSAGQFYRGLPLTFSLLDWIDPRDIEGKKLIVNPGDYIDHVLLGNKDPFTGYSYINIALLLQTSSYDPLLDSAWIDCIKTYYTPCVNLTVTKLQ